MHARGRPLRFLGVVLGGWTALRVAMLWPTPLPTAPVVALGTSIRRAPLATAPAEHIVARRPWTPGKAPARPPTAPVVLAIKVSGAEILAAILDGEREVRFGQPATQPLGSVVPNAAAVAGAGQAEPAATPASARAASATLAAAAQPTAAAPSRLQGDAYLAARGGRDGSLAFGQLGASQAGARLTYAIDPARRLALSARVATPFRGSGREVAAGLDWRPTRLHVHLLAEDRYDLDAHRHEPAAELIGGLYARGPLGLTLDAYAQAGAVARRGPFADGAARLFRPLRLAPTLRLELGAGGWGGAQRGAARLDLGPSASLALTGHGRQGVHAGLDYRFRVAGGASPDSGPALTLGAGF